MIASACGFDCAKCPIYELTVAENKKKRQELEAKYKLDKGVKCHGCLSAKCAKMCNDCNIRLCCIEKHIKSCAYCDEFYNCSEIMYIYNTNMESKTYLDSERKKYEESRKN